MELFAFIFGIIANDFFSLWFFFLFLLFFSTKQFLKILVCFLFGFLWMYGHEYLSFRYIKTDGFKIHAFKAKVLSFGHQKNPKFIKYLVEINSMDGQSQHFKLWLYDFDLSHHLLPGELWSWKGDFKPNVTYQNPGANVTWKNPHFRHIEGSSFVRSPLFREREISSFDVINRLRVHIYGKAYQLMKSPFPRSLFLTLILGLGEEIQDLEWKTFQLTGTVHLMVVSGEHLSIIMRLCSRILGFIFYFVPGLLRICPLKRMTSIMSLMIGLLYALISGFGIPVQRSWMMMFMRWFHFFGGPRIEIWQAYRWSLWIILLFEPHAIWYPGTYLSYLAVAIIIYCHQFRLYRPWVEKIFIQIACTLGLAPLTLLWFGDLPLLGLLANIVAIPCMAWVLLPLSFMTVVSMFIHVAYYPVLAMTVMAQAYQWILKQLSMLQSVNIYGHWSHSAFPWLILISMMIFAIYPKRQFLVSVLIIHVLLVFPHAYRIKPGAFVLDLLDVGQGLAVMIKTAHHHLLFDTAGAFGQASVAERTIMPYFQHEEISTLDKLVISHPDLDHRGGLAYLSVSMPIQELVVDNPKRYKNAVSCHHLKEWCWEQVCFRFIPYHVPRASTNNHSCVLQVFNQKFQALLTGDIERLAEYAILRHEKQKIRSTVMVIPHHGSQTSSSFWLLDIIKPKLALLSVGLFNAYHLPRPQVLERYQALHIPVLATSNRGMIRVFFNQDQFKVVTWLFRSGLDYWIYG